MLQGNFSFALNVNTLSTKNFSLDTLVGFPFTANANSLWWHMIERVTAIQQILRGVSRANDHPHGTRQSHSCQYLQFHCYLRLQRRHNSQWGFLPYKCVEVDLLELGDAY